MSWKLRDTEKHLRSINEEYRMLEAFCMRNAPIAIARIMVDGIIVNVLFHPSSIARTVIVAMHASPTTRPTIVRRLI